MFLTVNYVPLSGRWATLSLVIAIACGASAISLVADERMSSNPVTSLEANFGTSDIRNPWSVRDATSEGQSRPDQIVVVNPDGSARESSGELEVEIYEGDQPIGDFAVESAYADRPMPRNSTRWSSARRIE